MDILFSIGDGLDGIRMAIVSASAIASLAYLRLAGQAPSPARAWLKTFCFASLAFLPLTCLGATGVSPTGLICLAVALALSSLGDYLLAATDQPRFFVPGLASFLLAHVMFVVTFLPLVSMPGPLQVVVMALSIGASGMLMRILLPRLGRLRLPVVCYFLVINAMICVAVSASQAGWMLAGGAMLFAFSDSLIAVRKFLTPFRGIHETVWATYAIAQFVICLSVLNALLNLRN